MNCEINPLSTRENRSVRMTEQLRSFLKSVDVGMAVLLLERLRYGIVNIEVERKIEELAAPIHEKFAIDSNYREVAGAHGEACVDCSSVIAFIALEDLDSRKTKREWNQIEIHSNLLCLMTDRHIKVSLEIKDR